MNNKGNQLKFCSSCGTASQPDALYCGKCGKAFESAAQALKPNVDAGKQNITVVVKNESKTPIFSIFGICCGVLGIFTLGFVFIPLGFLFTLLGLLRGELLSAVISGVINIVGLLTSPVLVAMLGLGAIFAASNIPGHASDDIHSPESQIIAKPNNSGDSETTSQPASASGTNTEVVGDISQKPTETVEEQVASALKPLIERSQQAEHSPAAISVNFSEETYAALQSVLDKHAEHCPGTTKCDVNGFSLYPVDLDGDERPEFVVTHRDYCGAGGCTTLLMAEGPERTWNRLASVFGDISVEPTLTLGRKDLSFTLKVYRTEGGWYMGNRKFIWSGSEYISNDK